MTTPQPNIPPPPVDQRADQRHGLGLVESARVLDLVTSLFGDVPVLGVRVERDSVPVRVPGLPWPRQVESVDVAVHCADDEPAEQVAQQLGLPLTGSRRFDSPAAGVEFHESTWSGWLTTPDASRLAMPVSVSVAGSHAEPSPYAYEFIDDTDDDTVEDTDGPSAGEVA